MDDRLCPYRSSSLGRVNEMSSFPRLVTLFSIPQVVTEERTFQKGLHPLPYRQAGHAGDHPVRVGQRHCPGIWENEEDGARPELLPGASNRAPSPVILGRARGLLSGTLHCADFSKSAREERNHPPSEKPPLMMLMTLQFAGDFRIQFPLHRRALTTPCEQHHGKALESSRPNHPERLPSPHCVGGRMESRSSEAARGHPARRRQLSRPGPSEPLGQGAPPHVAVL